MTVRSFASFIAKLKPLATDNLNTGLLSVLSAPVKTSLAERGIQTLLITVGYFFK